MINKIMMSGYGHGMGLGMGWGWIIGLIVLAIVVWVVVRTTSQNAGTAPEGRETALDVLKKRYARGEIDKQEFEEKKKDLS